MLRLRRVRQSRAARGLLTLMLMALLVGAPTALGPLPQGDCPVPTTGCGGG